MAHLTAVLDANILYSAPMRDLLLRLALQDLYSARWTNTIHFEWINAVLRQRKDIKRERLERTAELMDTAVPSALVTDFENLIPTIKLPDLDDRHVLAAAIKGQADIIITYNLKDFPQDVLTLYNIEAQHPDTFIYSLLEQSLGGVLTTMSIHRASLKNPPKTVEQYLLTLENQGLARTVKTVNSFRDLI